MSTTEVDTRFHKGDGESEGRPNGQLRKDIISPSGKALLEAVAEEVLCMFSTVLVDAVTDSTEATRDMSKTSRGR